MDDRTLRKVWSWANDISSDAEAELRNTRGAVRDTLEQIIDKAELIKGLCQGGEEALERTVRKAMRTILDEDAEARTPHEWNSSELAEAAAAELKMSDVIDDPNHPIWDWAIEELDAFGGAVGFDPDDDDDDDDEEEEDHP